MLILNTCNSLLLSNKLSLHASSDDWIAAFDLEGNCAGAAQLVYIPAYGNVFFGVGLSNFVIFGDDPTTTDIDEGINAGEGFILKLWDSTI